jgi:hypothetical protein
MLRFTQSHSWRGSMPSEQYLAVRADDPTKLFNKNLELIDDCAMATTKSANVVGQLHDPVRI